MKKVGDGFQLSASDLVGFLNCRYLTSLDRAVAEGVLAKPASWNPALQALWERGTAHEDQFVAHLREQGLDVVVIDGVDVAPAAVVQTIAAMRVGRSIIVQGALMDEGWGGRMDVLRRVDTPSGLGAWSYEVTDTKLARETKAGTILQLCLYSELVAQVQERDPAYMDVVSPWTEFTPQRYRYHDFAAFYRKAKRGLAASVATPETAAYPDPKPHCEICRWAPAVCARNGAGTRSSGGAGHRRAQVRAPACGGWLRALPASGTERR
jgi:predicted RecB family nuclease